MGAALHATLLLGCMHLLKLGSAALPDDLSDAHEDHVCFRRTDFEQMFSPRTAKPDAQLAAYLRSHTADYHYPTFEEVHRALFHTDTSIYADFEQGPIVQYAGGVRPATIDFLKSQLDRPVQFMVEVGSFVGSSATMFSKHLLQTATPSPGILLCIDTWAGDVNMWLLDSFRSKMKLQHGSPSLYESFLSRIVFEGLQTSIVPLRASSTVGARMLHALRYRIDVIYLDSAHEAGETYVELSLYWELLPEGGLLCGDDYHAFPAVKHDVDLFMHHRRLPRSKLQFSPDNGRTWAIVKSAST